MNPTWIHPEYSMNTVSYFESARLRDSGYWPVGGSWSSIWSSSHSCNVLRRFIAEVIVLLSLREKRFPDQTRSAISPPLVLSSLAHESPSVVIRRSQSYIRPNCRRVERTQLRQSNCRRPSNAKSSNFQFICRKCKILRPKPITEQNPAVLTLRAEI